MLPPQVRSFYQQAVDDYEGFWEKAALDATSDIHWFRKWDKVFEWEYPSFRWFTGGETNISYNCLDRKVEQGRGSKVAFIAETGEAGEITSVTYAQVLELVNKCASALRGIGVQKGDRVAIYMEMGIEAAASMLACARIGAVHMVIFAGFSARAVADRLELSGAKYVLTQARGSRRGRPVLLKEIVDEALDMLPAKGQIKQVAILNRGNDVNVPLREGRDVLWSDFLARGEEFSSDYVIMKSGDPLFLLPTSGTTARPKVTLQTHGGYQVYCYSMGKWIYSLVPDDVWFCTSDIGWIVGHSYNVYTPLLVGCTSILYNGTPNYPRLDMWWDIIDRNKVTATFFSPTGVRALMMVGIEQARRHNLDTVQRVFCAGEVLNPAAWQWLQNDVFEGRIPVIDHMWQTETSATIVGNPYGLGMAPIKPGSATYPAPGIMADVVNEKSGHPALNGEKGVLVIRKPFPGLTPMLWGDQERYKRDYWEKIPSEQKVYYAGDAAYKDSDGYIWFIGRADEVIKISAHRVGTIELENVLISHPAVVEAGASGVPDELRGQVASAFVVLAKGYQPSDELREELRQHVRKTIGPIIVMKDVEFVNMLPKTRSGKIMRRVMASLLTGRELGDLSTIEEEASVDEIREVVQKMKMH